MRTIKTIPTVMLAVSLGTGILMSEAAFARDGGHLEHSGSRDHNDHQDHGDRRGGNERLSPQATHFGETGKRDSGKVTAIKTGSRADPVSAFKVTHGGNPPRAPVATTKAPPPAQGGTPSVTPAPNVNLPPPTHGGNPPRGPEAAAPGAPAVVSNGEVKLFIPNSPSGLSVTSNKLGTITVSNGDPTHSVTLPGGSVTISGGGVTTVGGAPGVQIITHPNGDFVAAAAPPAPNASAPAPVHVTGGPEGGFLNALGSGLKDIVDPTFTAKTLPENVVPPPKTSTIYQR